MTVAPVLVAEQLTKSYDGRTNAVEGLDLSIDGGQVYGLLGLNGAGKTTLMRMALGLVRPTAGSVTVLGGAPGAVGSTGRIGALVESPALHPHLSGRQNLTLLAKYLGIATRQVDVVLDQVDMERAADGVFRTYSLGMKQRLGVAAALLGDPELLVLDEPTNGTDPAGMAAMRDLVRRIGSEGRTVLLSSHLLSEVEQTCDRVAVMDSGALIAEGSIDEVRGVVSSGSSVVVIRVDRPAAAVELLQSLSGVTVLLQDGAEIRVRLDLERIGWLNRTLVEAGVDVSELQPVRHSLEEAFLGLTSPATLQPAE